MTGASKRDLERRLDDLADGVDDRPPMVVWEDPETGGWYDSPPLRGEADRVDREALEAAPRMIIAISETVVETEWSRDDASGEVDRR